MGNTPTDVQETKVKLLVNAAIAEKTARTVLTQMAVEKVYIDAGLETPWTMKNRFELFKIKTRCKGLLLAGRMARSCVRVIEAVEEYENAPEYLGEKR